MAYCSGLKRVGSARSCPLITGGLTIVDPLIMIQCNRSAKIRRKLCTRQAKLCFQTFQDMFFTAVVNLDPLSEPSSQENLYHGKDDLKETWWMSEVQGTQSNWKTATNTRHEFLGQVAIELCQFGMVRVRQQDNPLALRIFIFQGHMQHVPRRPHHIHGSVLTMILTRRIRKENISIARVGLFGQETNKTTSQRHEILVLQDTTGQGHGQKRSVRSKDFKSLVPVGHQTFRCKLLLS